MDSHIGAKYNFKCCVCGDDAIGFHFGGFSCESCKAFFRRNALNPLEFSCKHNGACQLDRITRRYCSSCRLKKCFAIGMKPEFIKSRDLSKNNKKLSKLIEPSEWTLNHNLTGPLSTIDFQSSEIEHFHQILHAMRSFGDETKLPVTGYATNGAQAFHLIGGYIRSVITFCKQLDAFKCLKPEDQLILLKKTFFPLTTVRFAFMFDRAIDAFPVADLENKSNAVYIKLDICAESKVENLAAHFRANNISFQDKMDNDVNIRNLISALFMFNQKTSSNLSCQEFIRYQYFIYDRLLQRYLLYKLGSKSHANERYCSIMVSMRTMDFIGQLLQQMYSQTNFDKSDKVWDEIFYS